MFLELFDFEFFFFKRNNFSEFYFFSKKMLVANFMRFLRKCLEKQTHIDNLKKKSKTNLFGFFVPFDALLKKSQKTRKTENSST